MAGGDLVATRGCGQGNELLEHGQRHVIVVAASDLHEEAPVWWLRVKQAAERGAALIVVNPRPTQLDICPPGAQVYIRRRSFGSVRLAAWKKC